MDKKNWAFTKADESAVPKKIKKRSGSKLTSLKNRYLGKFKCRKCKEKTQHIFPVEINMNAANNADIRKLRVCAVCYNNSKLEQHDL